MQFTRRSLLTSLPPLYVATADICLAVPARGAREIHVSVRGDDRNDGSPKHMLRTISAAAQRAMPGDLVTVHAGIYRERVDPPRGGDSEARPIVYRAASGEAVEINGAEPLHGWQRDRSDVWTVTLANSFFGDFNPYADVIHGDWFDPKGRVHHTGAVYLNREWLQEAATLDEVYEKTDAVALWFGRVDAIGTTLWAQFPGLDPNVQNVEVNVRRAVFYPSLPGRNYITVQGFRLRCAATPWAPPTAEQIGLIGTHWSKGWVIENNVISHSVCSGVSLGKHGDAYDNTSQDSAEGYVRTIERATARGWSEENIGHHIVRNNHISQCEQAGIVGSLGAIFSTVAGNTIHHIHVRRLFSGAEMAAIKFHAAIDTEICHNYIYDTVRAVWLDWMAQGTNLHSNVFRDSAQQDLFIEVNHGPYVVSNNLFLSRVSQRIVSSGGVYAHNLFCGDTQLVQYDKRQTPYMLPHSTIVDGLHDNPSGDMRFYNNLFAEGGSVSAFDTERLPSTFKGNVFLRGAKACSREANPLLEPGYDGNVAVIQQGESATVQWNADRNWATTRRRILVTTELLGTAAITKLPFQRPDALPLRITMDSASRLRDPNNPFPGPLEVLASGRQSISAGGATLKLSPK